MEQRKIQCPNCGTEMEVDRFAVSVICEACGNKVLISKKKEEESQSDSFDRVKNLLMNAYISREIDDIMHYSKEVLGIYPNDFFATFLYSYCLLRRGNNNAMLNFLNTAHFDKATLEEINIVMKEITKSQNYYEQKCSFIKRAESEGVPISEYTSYLPAKERTNRKKQEENQNNYSEKVKFSAKKVDKQTGVTFSVLCIIFFGFTMINNQESVEALLMLAGILIAITWIFTIVIANVGFQKPALIFAGIYSLGFYLLCRVIVTYLVCNKYVRLYNEPVSFTTLFMHKKV